MPPAREQALRCPLLPLGPLVARLSEAGFGNPPSHMGAGGPSDGASDPARHGLPDMPEAGASCMSGNASLPAAVCELDELQGALKGVR